MGWRDAAVAVPPEEAAQLRYDAQQRRSKHAQEVAHTAERAEELTGPSAGGDSDPSMIPDLTIPDFVPVVGGFNLRRFAPGEDSGAMVKDRMAAAALGLANRVSMDAVPTAREAMDGPLGALKFLAKTNQMVAAAKPAVDMGQRGLTFAAEHGAPVPDFLLDRAPDPESDEGRELSFSTPEATAADIAPAAFSQGELAGDVVNAAMGAPGLKAELPGMAKSIKSSAGLFAGDVKGAAAAAAQKAPAVGGAAVGGALGSLVGQPAGGAALGGMAGKAAFGGKATALADELRLRAEPPVDFAGAADDIMLGGKGVVDVDPAAIVEELRLGATPAEAAEKTGAPLADVVDVAKQQRMQGGPGGAPHVTSKASPSEAMRFSSPTPEVTGQVNFPQPAPTAAPPAQLRFDPSGHPEGMGPADFPLEMTPEAAAQEFAKNAAGQSSGFAMPADMLRQGLRLPGETVDPRGPRMGGNTPVFDQPVVEAQQSVAAEQPGQPPSSDLTLTRRMSPAQSNDLRIQSASPEVQAMYRPDPQQFNPTRQIPTDALAELRALSSAPLSSTEAPATRGMSLLEQRTALENPEARAPMNPADFPGQGVKLFPEAEPGQSPTAMLRFNEEPLPGVGKMPARFPSMPTSEPQTWTPAQQAQAARRMELEAQLAAMPPDQRAAAIRALGQAHGSADWQAGGLGAAPTKPVRSEARYDAPLELGGKYGRPLPASMEGAHTVGQELAGVNGFGALDTPMAVSEPSPIDPHVKAIAEEMIRANLEQAKPAPTAAEADPLVNDPRQQGMLSAEDKPHTLPKPEPRPVEEDLPSFVRKTPKEMGITGDDAKSRTWKLREEGEAIEPGYIRKQTAAEAKADALPKDRSTLLQQLLEANGIKDYDSAAADAAYKAWKAGGRKGPKPTHNLGGMLDAFDAVKDKPGSVSSLLEAFEKQTRKAKTYRDLKPALDALAEALGVDSIRLPDEVLERHIQEDAARSSR